MALSKTITTSHGFQAVDAYHRVEAVSINSKNSFDFHVRSYKEIDWPFFGEKVISAPFNLNGDNPFKQAYLHLKTLPEFEDAVDC
jgi:hypothetical protein